MPSLFQRFRRAFRHEIRLLRTLFASDRSFLHFGVVWGRYRPKVQRLCLFHAPSLTPIQSAHLLPSGLDIRLAASPDDFVALRNADFCYPAMHAHFVHCGAKAIVVREHGAPVHVSWVFPMKELQTANVAWCATHPEHRGKSYYPYALMYARMTLVQTYSRYRVSCLPDNTASIRGILKAGFVFQHVEVTVQVLNYLCLWRRKRLMAMPVVVPALPAETP